MLNQCLLLGRFGEVFDGDRFQIQTSASSLLDHRLKRTSCLQSKQSEADLIFNQLGQFFFPVRENFNSQRRQINDERITALLPANRRNLQSHLVPPDSIRLSRLNIHFEGNQLRIDRHQTSRQFQIRHLRQKRKPIFSHEVSQVLWGIVQARHFRKKQGLSEKTGLSLLEVLSDHIKLYGQCGHTQNVAETPACGNYQEQRRWGTRSLRHPRNPFQVPWPFFASVNSISNAKAAVPTSRTANIFQSRNNPALLSTKFDSPRCPM